MLIPSSPGGGVRARWAWSLAFIGRAAEGRRARGPGPGGRDDAEDLREATAQWYPHTYSGVVGACSTRKLAYAASGAAPGPPPRAVRNTARIPEGHVSSRMGPVGRGTAGLYAFTGTPTGEGPSFKWLEPVVGPLRCMLGRAGRWRTTAVRPEQDLMAQRRRSNQLNESASCRQGG